MYMHYTDTGLAFPLTTIVVDDFGNLIYLNAIYPNDSPRMVKRLRQEHFILSIDTFEHIERLIGE